ncbi:MAG: 3'-5' exonuclease [Muribaculaceae bacterium]|nr:3'-5' exonuclease [Muribaculaceae bacterium]
MNIICLDAEFADNEELLELSAFNLAGEEVYHSYYRPENIREWRTDIHHITPGMVAGEKSFAARREEVQNMLDSAYALTGFAVENDIRVLTRSGIRGLEEKPVLDVKDIYWLLKGREEGMSPFAVPSLLVCANSLGLEFSEDEAHSASADTEVTLRCFNMLLEEYAAKTSLSGEALVRKLMESIADAKADFIEAGARGFVKVFKMGDVYKVKYGRSEETDRRNLLLEVAVADRYKAEYEIRKLLKKKEVADKYSVYKLTARLLDEIGRYSNEYDAEESAWCKKVVRNLSRLTL